MNWFYELDGQQMGPVSEAELMELFRAGRLKGTNLVWREGMADWEPLQTILPPPPPPRLALDPRGIGAIAPSTAEASGAVRHNVDICVECGRTYPNDELVTLNKAKVCAGCKPKHLQRMAEGALTYSMEGLWREGKKMVTSSETPMPDRCVKCNAPAHGYRLKRVLYWHHPAYYLLLLCNLLILLIVVLIVRKKAVLHVGLCETHRKQRKQALIALWVGFLGGLGCLIGSAVIENGWLALFGGVAILTGIVWAVVKGRVIQATKIDKDGTVWVGGVCKAFLDELPER
jgi:hypothetical protein